MLYEVCCLSNNKDYYGTQKYIRWAENSVRTSQETHYVSATKPNVLILFRETVTVYCENHTEHTNTLCGQNVEFFNDKADGENSDH
jgi:hypothetical protein